MRCGPPGSLNPTAIAVAYEGAGSRPTPAPGEKKRILAAIDAKIAGKEVVASPHAGEEAGAQVIDLTQALMASLKGTCCDCEGADCSQASAGEGWGQRGRDGCQALGRAPSGQDRGTGCGTGTHPRARKCVRARQEGLTPTARAHALAGFPVAPTVNSHRSMLATTWA